MAALLVAARPWKPAPPAPARAAHGPRARACAARSAAGATRPRPPARPRCIVLREVRNCEGSFDELRAAGAPPEGPSYADADAAAAVFSAVAPIGLQRYETSKLVLPLLQQAAAAAAAAAAAGEAATAGAEAAGE
jgi:hypothetical protein